VKERMKIDVESSMRSC